MVKANSPKYIDKPNVKHTVDNMQKPVTVYKKEIQIN